MSAFLNHLDTPESSFFNATTTSIPLFMTPVDRQSQQTDIMSMMAQESSSRSFVQYPSDAMSTSEAASERAPSEEYSEDAHDSDNNATPASGATSTSKPRRRPRATPEQLAVLESTYKNTTTSPRGRLRADLAKRLNITERSVQVWFQNRRAKDKMSEKRSLLRELKNLAVAAAAAADGGLSDSESVGSARRASLSGGSPALLPGSNALRSMLPSAARAFLAEQEGLRSDGTESPEPNGVKYRRQSLQTLPPPRFDSLQAPYNNFTSAAGSAGFATAADHSSFNAMDSITNPRRMSAPLPYNNSVSNSANTKFRHPNDIQQNQQQRQGTYLVSPASSPSSLSNLPHGTIPENSRADVHAPRYPSPPVAHFSIPQADGTFPSASFNMNSDSLPLSIHAVTIGTWHRISMPPQASVSAEFDLASQNIRITVLDLPCTHVRLSIPATAVHGLELSPVSQTGLDAQLHMDIMESPTFEIFMHNGVPAIDPMGCYTGVDLSNTSSIKQDGQWVRCSDFTEGGAASSTFSHILSGSASVLNSQLIAISQRCPSLRTAILRSADRINNHSSSNASNSLAPSSAMYSSDYSWTSDSSPQYAMGANPTLQHRTPSYTN